MTLLDGNLDIGAASAVLIEPKTGTVLYEKDSDVQLAPASITKIMSLLLVMEAIEEGKLTLETEITAGEHACSMGGSQIWLEPGEKMTVDELLKAVVIASANDATVALGEAISGSEQAFVELMNERAEQLSMTGTHFLNCTGLDADGHVTTAYDVAVMSCELIKHRLITKYSTVWMDTLRGGESQLVNTNKLVRFYDGCIGLKTGTTSKAGYCLSAAAERDGMTLIAVVMNGDDSNARFAAARAMLDFGFANYSFLEIESELEENTFVKIKGGERSSAKVEAEETLSVLCRKGSPEVTRQVFLEDTLKAPVNKGDTVGKIMVSVDGEEVGAIPIKAAEKVKKRSILTVYGWLIRGIVSF
ncbi:MAG: D-alanyl-D-alanine carboxypeptidase [Clostridia bacterium]|nr:D-alanyl-D-alanine carboxypeptidase [Clostridia bacterium]MBR3593944.1 D-alanyl-D-alanine carboxypeptidase [Clostridia bacterium]